MTVRPTYSVAYSVRADGLPPSRTGFTAPRMNKPEGIIRKKAANRINNAVQWMVLFSHKKRVYSKTTKKSYWFLINFITLTLSGKQEHSDEFIKNHMLYPFLRWMARSHKAKMYLWKAEAQKNGNIHFHITANTFIHWKSIRRKWNQIQSKHGYLRKWTEGNVRGDPNSTDVHAVIKTEQIAKYMCKYMVKNEPDRRKIEGRLWACSPALSGISCFIDEMDDNFKEAADTIKKQSEIKQLDHACLYIHRPLNRMTIPHLLREKLLHEYEKVKPLINPQTYFTIE